MKLSIALRTQAGHAINPITEKLKPNEDFYAYDRRRQLFVLADGVTGAHSSRRTSRYAIRLFLEHFNGQVIDTAQYVNDRIARERKQLDKKLTLTTLLAMYFDREKTKQYMVYKGDTHAYQIRGKHLWKISKEYHHGVQAIGFKVGAPMYSTATALREGDLYLAATDGLTDFISPTEIISLVHQDRDLEKRLDQLFTVAGSHARAHRHRIPDDMTAFLIRVDTL